jgi:hypothetical protein
MSKEDLRLDSHQWGVAHGGSAGESDDVTRTPKMLSAFSASNIVQNQGLAHRIVWALPEDAASPGATLKEGEKEYPVPDYWMSAVMIAKGTARARGGAWIWVVLKGDTADSWGEEIGGSEYEIAALHVFSADEANVQAWEEDAAKTTWGEPSHITLTPSRKGFTFSGSVIHSTRLVYVPGLRKWPGQESLHDDRDLSVLDLYRPAIEALDTGWRSVTRLLARRAMPWLKLALAKAVKPTERGGEMRRRMGQIAAGMLSRAMMFLGKDDEIGWTAPPMTGTTESMSALWTAVSAVEGIPVSRLAGTPPGGLSTDDGSGKRSYDSAIGRCRDSMTPALLRFYEIQDGEDMERHIEWGPIEKQDPLQVAQASLVRAQRDSALIMSGVILPDESRARFEGGEESDLPELGELIPVDEPEPEPTPQIADVEDVTAPDAEGATDGEA